MAKKKPMTIADIKRARLRELEAAKQMAEAKEKETHNAAVLETRRIVEELVPPELFAAEQIDCRPACGSPENRQYAAVFCIQQHLPITVEIRGRRLSMVVHDRGPNACDYNGDKCYHTYGTPVLADVLLAADRGFQRLLAKKHEMKPPSGIITDPAQAWCYQQIMAATGAVPHKVLAELEVLAVNPADAKLTALAALRRAGNVMRCEVLP